MKTVAVCIINHNTRDLVRECLLSVLTENPNEIIVVDSASTDGSVAMLQAEFPYVTVIALDKNIGFGAASNQGIQRARSEHLILLNADTRMKPGSLQALNHYLETHPQAAMIGPRILDPDGTLQTSCFYFPTPLHIFLYISDLYQWIPRLPILKQRTLQKVYRGTAVAVPWILGAALAFRREQIQQLGGFDERFFMYFEEVDLCYRLSSRGQQIYFVPEAELIHVGGGSTTQKGPWPYVQFFASLAQFYRKHYSRTLLTKMVLIVKVVALFKLIGGFLLMVGTRDVIKQSVLKANLNIHRNLLFGHWHQHADARTAADVF
jgi:GT2 family glycosyltransferase